MFVKAVDPNDELYDPYSVDLTLEHFYRAFKDPAKLETLAYLELDADDADGMFSMFDVDGTGYVNHGEVIDGLLRFRGQAKAKHLLECHCDFERLADDVTFASQFSENRYEKASASLLRNMEDRMSEWYWMFVEAMDPDQLRPQDFPEQSLKSSLLELAADFPIVQEELDGMGIMPDLNKSMSPHMFGRNLDALLAITESLERVALDDDLKPAFAGPPTELPRAHPALAGKKQDTIREDPVEDFHGGQDSPVKRMSSSGPRKHKAFLVDDGHDSDMEVEDLP
jgi:hypothetical protein